MSAPCSETTSGEPLANGEATFDGSSNVEPPESVAQQSRTSQAALSPAKVSVEGQLSNAPQRDTISQAISQEPKDNVDDPYGLTGMLKVVRMNDLNLNVLALGTDLTSLGLNLNERETLSSSFASPLLDEQPPKEEFNEFTLPPYYYINPPALKITQLQNFTPETLFYIFYTVVGSALQGYAAAELYNRGWVYHNTFRKWFTTIAAQRQTGSMDARDMEAKVNEWIYFEPAVWEKRYHSGSVDTSRFMKPSDLRELLNNFIQHLYPPGVSPPEAANGDLYGGLAVNIDSSSALSSPNTNTLEGLSDMQMGGSLPRAYNRSVPASGMALNNNCSNQLPPPPPGFGNSAIEPGYVPSETVSQDMSHYGSFSAALFQHQRQQPSSQHHQNCAPLGSVGVRYS